MIWEEGSKIHQLPAFIETPELVQCIINNVLMPCGLLLERRKNFLGPKSHL